MPSLTTTLPAETTSQPVATGTVLTVGPGSQFATLAAAIAASHDGDTIQVQAGTYTNDFATINTRINLIGVGGMVHLVATGNIPNGKAILVTNADVTITNFEFSGAQVVDGNGAGVRYQAGNLTLSNCYFHNNQDGLLAADNATGNIAINTSEFANNGVSDPAAVGYGFTHNLYVGHVATLTITGSYFHDAAVGHEIKSRALATTIQDSRIVDGTMGTASYSIDLPNGGNAIIKNNVIEQGPHSQNPAIIAFGEEGSLNANTSLQVTGNTILNDLSSSSSRAVNNLTTASALISGNQFFGLTTAQIANGPNVQSNNVLLASEPALDASHPWSATTDTTASTPTLTVTAASGSEDKAIALGNHISAALTDTDGSETLAIKIAGLPTGAKLSAGTNNGGGVWTLTAAQLAGLTITPPKNADAAISLTVTATAKESNGGATASKSATLAVTVTGVADAPTLTVSDTHGPKNTAISLGSHISAALADTDGSETLAIKIAGVPTGATLSAGTNNGGGVWTLTPAQLANLTIKPPANSTTAIALTVSAVSTEDNATTATTAKTLNVTIDSSTDTTASTPALAVTPTSGNEDAAIALGSHISAALTDTDGSEKLAIKIAGVPTGATLSAGTNNGGGVWTLTPAQLANLTIKPPANSDAGISLTVTATATEANGGATASKSGTLAVTVTGVADAPTLTVSDTHGAKNTAIALGSHITAALTDTDGSETLAIKIAGVPTGATLSGGTNNGGGNWTLTPAQLTNLKITPPSSSTTPIALTVSAVSKEDNGTTATTSKTINVAIDSSVLTVGPGSQFATLAAAIAASHDGDTIQVQAGTYTNDFATINTRINLIGVGGMVHLVATGNIPNGKAILVTNADVTITNFEFSGAQVVDGNGAGVRYQAGNLTLSNCYFHNNQDGLLAADNATGNIAINTSEFANNGVSDPAAVGYGFTHNLYVGHVATLTITGSYFHDAAVGHEIKSRALATTIQDSRIVDGTMGTASYSIDLPNGGNAIIKNNVIEQGPHSQNPAIIAFGEEGSLNANTSLQVTGNTILNDLSSSSSRAVNNLTTASALISGNQFFGLTTAQIANGPNVQSNNVLLASEPALDASHPWSATQGSINLLIGSTVNDYLKGNAGADTFVFAEAASGHDKIADFTVGTDHVQIKQNLNGNALTTAAAMVAAATTDSAGNVVLHLGGQDDITLLGVDLLHLTAASVTMFP